MPLCGVTKSGAEIRQQGLRHRRHVAIAVDHRIMRGAGRRQMFGAERAAAVGIAHAFQPLAIGRLHGLRIAGIGRCIRAAPGRRQFLLQQAQRVRQGRAAGQFRRRVDRAAAIGDFERLAHMSTERGEVLGRQRAATGLHVGGDALRQVALVEIARAGCGEMFKRRLQTMLRHAQMGPDAPLRIRRQAVEKIGGAARRIAPQVGGRA